MRIITLITPTASLCILFDLPHHDFSFFTLFTLFQLFVLFFGQKEKNWVVSLGILSGSSSGSSFPLSYISRIFLHVLNPLLPNVRTLSFWLYTLLLHPPLSSFSNAFFYPMYPWCLPVAASSYTLSFLFSSHHPPELSLFVYFFLSCRFLNILNILPVSPLSLRPPQRILKVVWQQDDGLMCLVGMFFRVGPGFNALFLPTLPV